MKKCESELKNFRRNKLTSERASRGAGGPTSNEPGSEQASDQASDEDASKQR